MVVLAGSFLGAAEKMLQKGIHPTILAESFMKASAKAVEYLTEMSTPVDLNDKASLLRAASTSLNSKVRGQVSLQTNKLTPFLDRISIFRDTRPHRSFCCYSSGYPDFHKC